MGKKKKPKDRTAVSMISVSYETGEILEDTRTDWDYASLDDPLHLPGPALCNETIDEWAAFKKWEIDEKARKVKGKLWLYK